MPKFAANLSMMFTEYEFLARFQKAKDAGFQGVEYMFPYDFPVDAVTTALKTNDLQQVLFNLPAGDWAKGERGIACLPDRVEAFRQGVDLAVTYAQALNCTQLNCLAGIRPNAVSVEQATETFIDNVKYAATQLQTVGIRLVIEMINTQDVPGFFLNTSEQALTLLARIAHTNVKLQYDIYHMQIMEGNLVRTLRDNLPKIGHIQVADNPGRHEPGTGEINFDFVFQELDRLGYDGWVGCEYLPKSTTEAGLTWLDSLMQSSKGDQA